MRYEAQIFYEGAKSALQPLQEALLKVEYQLGGDKAASLVRTFQVLVSSILSHCEARAEELYPEVPITPEVKPILLSRSGGFAPGSEKE